MALSQAEKKFLGSIAFLYLIRMLGLFMVLPVLSIYGAELPGATTVKLGVAMGVYGLTQACLQIPFGWLSDKYGRRPVLMFGFILFVIGSLMCAQAETVDLLILGRAVQGAGAVSAVLIALVADHIDERNRTMAMALVGISIGVSFGMSIVFGPLVATYGGLSGIFGASITLGLLACVIVFLLSEREPPRRTVPAKDPVVVSPNLLRLDLGIFILHFMQMCIWVAVPDILIENLGIPLDTHWVLYLSVVGGGFILMAPFMRFWDRRGQAKRSILVAGAVCCISMLLMSHTHSYALFVSGLLLFFWGFNLLEATLPSTLTKSAVPGSEGAAAGLYSSCQFLGVFAGGAVGGLVLSWYGTQSLFYLSAALSLVWCAAVLPARGLGWSYTGLPENRQSGKDCRIED